MYYRIIANIDTKFASLEEALQVYNTSTLVLPSIPETTMDAEDRVTPRIPVSETLEGCVTAIGVWGRFRRCCSSNEGAKSYEAEGHEAYPIIVMEFSDDIPIYAPTPAQVPDVVYTGELWILTPIYPSKVNVMWVHPESITYKVIDNEYTLGHTVLCTHIKVYSELEGSRHHPWITGYGNVMDSAELWNPHKFWTHEDIVKSVCHVRGGLTNTEISNSDFKKE